MEERDCPVWTGQQMPGGETWSVMLPSIWRRLTIDAINLCLGRLEQWLCHVPPAAAGDMKQTTGSSGGWSRPLRVRPWSVMGRAGMCQARTSDARRRERQWQLAALCRELFLQACQGLFRSQAAAS